MMYDLFVIFVATFAAYCCMRTSGQCLDVAPQFEGEPRLLLIFGAIVLSISSIACSFYAIVKALKLMAAL